MRIAIDFDGVIFDQRKGTMIDGAQIMRTWHADGHEITVFTNRPDYDYTSVRAILEGFCLPFDRLIMGKPSYDIFIDDRATHFTEWQSITL